MSVPTPPIVRFAPSPTGRLHIGNIRTALLNWLFAARHRGCFLLRIDDTDRQRSTQAFDQGIREDLAWLGLTWEALVRQSDRMARYASVADALKASGRLYPCYEAEDELQRRRARQRARGLPPQYDRASLRLTSEERARLEAEGRLPHWRFRLDNTGPGRGDTPQPTLVDWVDLVRGDQSVDLGSLSDPVLIRADGTPLYTFTSVVDDIDFKVSHIIRGEDHVTNTGVQIDIFKALEAPPPRFAHHSLLVAGDGQALSKRLGALSIASLREDGIEAMAIACHAALLGTPEAIAIYPDLASLAQHCDIERVSRAPGRFDVAELAALNGRYLHGLNFAAVAERLARLGVGGGEAFWHAVRANILRLTDAKVWWAVVAGPIEPVVEDRALLEAAAKRLPPEPWDEATFGAWTTLVRQDTGVKGRQLYHPLRLALTGRDAGPELKALLPLMGLARVAARLRGEVA